MSGDLYKITEEALDEFGEQHSGSHHAQIVGALGMIALNLAAIGDVLSALAAPPAFFPFEPERQ